MLLSSHLVYWMRKWSLIIKNNSENKTSCIFDARRPEIFQSSPILSKPRLLFLPAARVSKVAQFRIFVAVLAKLVIINASSACATLDKLVCKKSKFEGMHKKVNHKFIYKFVVFHLRYDTWKSVRWLHVKYKTGCTLHCMNWYDQSTGTGNCCCISQVLVPLSHCAGVW